MCLHISVTVTVTICMNFEAEATKSLDSTVVTLTFDNFMSCIEGN